MYAAAQAARSGAADDGAEARAAEYPPGLRPWALMPRPSKYMGNEVFVMTNRRWTRAPRSPRTKAEEYTERTAFYNEHLRTAAPVVIEGIGARDEWVAVRMSATSGG